MVRRLCLVALLVVMLGGLAGCGGQQDVSDHPLVGTWNWVEDTLWQWRFQADGTGFRGGAGEETRFSWHIEDGGHLRLNIQGGRRESWSYLISGYTLTLDNRQLAGETYTYRRADAPLEIDLELVDRWLYDGDALRHYTFFADGTGILGLLDTREVFTWSVPEPGQLRIRTETAGYKWHYTLDGARLTLTNQQTGAVYDYTRESAVSVLPLPQEPEIFPEPDEPMVTEAPDASLEPPAESEQFHDEAALIGRWACQDDTAPHAWMCLFIFEADGRFTDGDGDQGTFFVDGSYLTLVFDRFQPTTVTFMVLGDSLTLQGEEMDVVLVRQS